MEATQDGRTDGDPFTVETRGKRPHNDSQSLEDFELSGLAEGHSVSSHERNQLTSPQMKQLHQSGVIFYIFLIHEV